MSAAQYGGSVRVITGPAGEPVTLAEGKLWCRIDDDDTTQDAMITLLIRAMREHAEKITGRAFVERTLQLRINGFPCREIELPHAPLQSVTAVEYTDGDGSTQSLSGSPSVFLYDADSEPGIVYPVYGTEWPATRDDIASVRITYVCGYASTSKIPAAVRQWMQVRIATLFENREQLIRGNFKEIPHDFVDGLLDYLRVSRMFA